MDTEKLFCLDGELDDVDFFDLDPKELKIVKYQVEITRHLQEIQQLYLVFKFNIDTLFQHYALKDSGEIIRNNGSEDPAISPDDYIAINALVTNLISSGKTLTESMNAYMKGKNSEEEFIEYSHDIYDHSFAYRLLVRLRDYAQHGHLPVNKTDSWYGFELNQVLEKPHYNHNKTMKMELKNAVDEILEVYHQVPRIPLLITLIEYFAQLTKIYSKFWTFAETHLNESNSHFNQVVAANPQNIVYITQNISLFMYELVDSHLECVSPEDNPIQMLREYKEQAIAHANQYEELWKKLRSGKIMVSVDKSRSYITVKVT